MQRNRHIPIKDKIDQVALQAMVEAALEELRAMIDQKTVTSFTPLNPVENLIQLNESTNELKVYNTSPREWVTYQPA